MLAALVEASWGAVHPRGSVFERKFRKWVPSMGKKKATIAICRSLLRVIHVVLHEDKPYQEPNTSELQELERKNKVLRCGNQLRKLGADAAVVDQMVQQILCAAPQPDTAQPIEASGTAEDSQPSDSSEVSHQPSQRPQACRGALGFRARQTREQYSNVKYQPGDRASKPAPRVKQEAQANPDSGSKTPEASLGANSERRSHPG